MLKLSCFQNRSVALLGLGKSGISLARSLLEGGARVLAWDDNLSVRSRVKDFIPLYDLNTVDWNTVDTFILSPGIPHTYPAPHPIVLAAKSCHLEPVTDIEGFFRILAKNPAPIVGISGTNGKTTVTALLTHVARALGLRTEMGGNIGIPVLDLPYLENEGLYVIELSSFQLELAPSLDLDVAVIVNITPDHLDRHGGLEKYIKVKERIFQNKEKPLKAVIGIDDPICLEIFQRLKLDPEHEVVPISCRQMVQPGICVVRGILKDTLTSNDPFIFNFQKNSALKGAHNDQNAAAAYGVLRLLDFSGEEIVASQGFQTFPGMPHRQEMIACVGGVCYVNDSKATNADSVACALRAYGTDCASPYDIYWIAGGRFKGGASEALEAINPFIQCIKEAFLIGEAAEFFEDILRKKGIACRISHTLEKACSQATQKAKQSKSNRSPLVLLSPACASFDKFRDFEHRGDTFREWVLHLAQQECFYENEE